MNNLDKMILEFEKDIGELKKEIKTLIISCIFYLAAIFAFIMFTILLIIGG